MNGSSLGNNGYDHTSLPTTISGTHPSAGAVTATLDGAFFGPGTPPTETAGEVSVTGTNYQAHGVYAATR